LPVQVPLRNLFLASGSAIVGSFEVIFWAALGLPRFVLVAGVALILVGVGIALWCLIAWRQRKWVVYVGSSTITVTRGTQRSELPWTDVGDVRLEGRRLAVLDRSGRRRWALWVDRSGAESETLHQLVAAAAERTAA